MTWHEYAGPSHAEVDRLAGIPEDQIRYATRRERVILQVELSDELQVELSDELAAWLRETATQREISVSELVNEIIREALWEHRDDADPADSEGDGGASGVPHANSDDPYEALAEFIREHAMYQGRVTGSVGGNEARMLIARVDLDDWAVFQDASGEGWFACPVVASPGGVTGVGAEAQWLGSIGMEPAILAARLGTGRLEMWASERSSSVTIPAGTVYATGDVGEWEDYFGPEAERVERELANGPWLLDVSADGRVDLTERLGNAAGRVASVTMVPPGAPT